MYLTITLIFIIATLVGSIPFAYILCGPIVANEGSQNIGATNAARVMGRKYGVMVFILDALKSICAISMAYKINPDFVYAAFVGVINGHVIQIFLRNHYGKGVSVFIGGIIYICPLITPIFIGGYIMGYVVRKVSVDGSTLSITSGYLGFIMQNMQNENSVLIFNLTTIGMGLIVLAHTGILQRH